MRPVPPLAAEVIAGYVAGSAKTVALYPLDTLTTWREVGVRSTPRVGLPKYYSGVGVTLLGALPYAAVFHTAFWYTEAALARLVPIAFLKVLAGTAGAIAAAAVGVPFECLKHRMQVGGVGYGSPVLALRTALRKDGVRGLYAGMSSTLARNIPYNALHFSIFEIAVGLLRKVLAPRSAAQAWCDLLAGATAGALTAVLTTPMDVVNTRLQTQDVLDTSALRNASGLAIIGAPDCTRYAGPLDATVKLVEQDGPVALLQGAGVRCAQYAPAALIFFVVFEAIKRYLTSPM